MKLTFTIILLFEQPVCELEPVVLRGKNRTAHNKIPL